VERSLVLYVILCLIGPLAWGVAVARLIARTEQKRAAAREADIPTDYEI